ncbi:MAG: helix-turn-helix domain-containing protein [Candidatus Omnitrophota bacterium]|nr:helix-turn-helix domain-containing protein [Candidatus Omnitrophota bacterium]
MAEEKLLTVRDVSLILGISEKEVMDLAEGGALPAYKIAGVYLRFKKDQVQEYKKLVKPPRHKQNRASAFYSLNDRVSDFFYFNDFYILTILIMALLLVIIFRGF